MVPPHTVQSCITRIDFPIYNGLGNPNEWVYCIKHFFHYQKTREDENVELPSFHLKQEALQWFQWWEKNQLVMMWCGMWKAFCIRFGPTNYENFNEFLSHVRQAGTLSQSVW